MRNLLIGLVVLLTACGGKIGHKDDPNRHKIPVHYASLIGNGVFDLCPSAKFPASVFPIVKAFSYTDSKVQKLVISFDGKINHLLDVKSKEDFIINNRFVGRLVSFTNIVDKEGITLNFTLVFEGIISFSYTLFSQHSITPIQVGAETLTLRDNCSQTPVFFKVETKYEIP